jgi:hypothetical protein
MRSFGPPAMRATEAEKDRLDRQAIVAALQDALRRNEKALIGNAGYRRYLRKSSAVRGERAFEIDAGMPPSFVRPTLLCRRARDRRSHQSQRSSRKRADVAAVQGVVPRRPEFRWRSRKLNNLSILGVQLGFDWFSRDVKAQHQLAS